MGKDQPLSAKIKIPGGWTTMGEIKVGDTVTAWDGSPTKVTGVYPQGIKKVYRVHFGDGRYTEVGGGHLWKVYNIFGSKTSRTDRGKEVRTQEEVEANRWSVITTQDIIDLKARGNVGKWLYVPLCEPEDTEPKVFKIHPYVLGVILGDGGLTSGMVKISKPNQQELFDKVQSLLSEDLECRWEASNRCFNICYKGATGLGEKREHIRKELIQNGLMGLKSHEKFIPKEYLHGSRQQRLDLLQGLLDTDGTISKVGQLSKSNGKVTNQTCGSVSFCSTSEKLALGVQYLVRSLGGIAKMSIRNPFFTYKGERKPGRKAYQVNIRYPRTEELFSIPHKASRVGNNQYSATLKLRIKDIEERPAEPTQCIAIDHPDHLYITDDFIVTHNTSILRELNFQPAENGNYRNGRKYVEWITGKRVYKLDSRTGVGNGHSFKIDDGPELNTGGTYSAQKELVYNHLGKADANLIRVLNGLKITDRISAMTPNRRKELIL